MESHLVAEHIALTLSRTSPRLLGHRLLHGHGDHETDNLVNGRRVDLLAAHNAANNPDIAEVPAFSPPPRRTVPPTWAFRGSWRP
ncbi:MAG TPA: hypothetical protein VLJ88_06215 [Propionibacteriaceae bacterium]|nr:hypothetical protein [Propionibacteriaceae bacterium]